MAKQQQRPALRTLRVVGNDLPTHAKQTVDRTGKTNEALRSREYLTEKEVEQLIKAARRNRWGHRDSTMILVAYRHGLRVSELVNLRWDQVDLSQGMLHVRRAKRGTPNTHPLSGTEIRALRRLQRESPTSPFLFVSERGGPVSVAGFQKMLTRLGETMDFHLKLHPHMLRHACGYKLANDERDTRAIQHYLGHQNIQHTVRYTELAADRFKDFWDD